MTRSAVRRCSIAVAAIFATGVACGVRSGAAQPARLQVALRSSVSPRAGLDLLAGDTIAAVRLGPAPATLVSTPAGDLLPPFRAALAGTARPATSPEVALSLPDPSPGEPSGMPFDVLFFNDLNLDGVWQGGEPYVTAWSGGRGGYRLILEPAPSGRSRWVLEEGGAPPTRHPDIGALVVYIDPVRPAVER